MQVNSSLTISTNSSIYDTIAHPVVGLLSNENIIKNCADDLVKLISSGYALTMEVATNDATRPEDNKKAEHAITLWGLDYHLDKNKAIFRSPLARQSPIWQDEGWLLQNCC